MTYALETLERFAVLSALICAGWVFGAMEALR